jgi:cation diffusion facilitator family transporter
MSGPTEPHGERDELTLAQGQKHVQDGALESRGFFKLMVWGYISMFPMAALFITVSVLADSSAVLVIAVQYLVSIVVSSFGLYAMRQVMADNVYSFPYGAGKLENFSAFLCGVLYVPTALYLMYGAGGRLMDPPEVGYLLAQVPVVISFCRMVVLYLIVRRMMRRSPNPSPLMRSYLLDYRIGLYSDGGVLISFAIGGAFVWLGLSAIGNRVDPMVALVISGYMIWVGVSLVRHNLRSLMDLPLSEAEQLKVMRVVAAHFNDYDSVGTLYTRSSGKRRFVEIELGFDDEQTVGHVRELSHHMEAALTAELPDLAFRVVPLR